MPSKGIDVYSYIAVPGCQVEFSVPKQSIRHDALNVFKQDHVEVDYKNLGNPFKYTGRFTFKVSRNGSQLASQWNDINALTGNTEDGTMKSMDQQHSITVNDIIISYGFYDAGPGVAGLPSSDRCWVTVSPNYSKWMEWVAPPGSPQADKPFSRFVLPAAHDVGMNSMQNSEAIIQYAGAAAVDVMLGSRHQAVAKIVHDMSKDALKLIAPNIIRGLAITQKDTLEMMLALGARYFEFRPCYNHEAIQRVSPLPKKLYFQHSAIPGMAYDQFLHDIVQFLVSYPQEIVVVQLRYDGIPPECPRPTDQDLRNELNAALGEAKGSVIQGSVDDMQNLTTRQLREQKKRLILFPGVDSFSTYTDAASATLNGDTIIKEFEKMSEKSQAGKRFTNLQCQATATNIPDVVVYSVLASEVSTSCLLATKPICDSKTLPWIAKNALDRLKAEQMVVIMNDFFDGGTADVGVGLSRQRLNK